MTGRLPILLYHDLGTGGSVLEVRPEIFSAQMHRLHEMGARVISLREGLACLAGRRPLPDRAVAITFDDGFGSVFDVAFPALARFGFPATVFLVPGYCGRTNDWPGQPPGIPRRALVTWPQVREMDRRGIEFGAHTISHPRLDLLPPDRVEEEVVGSRAAIEDALGHGIHLFSYPYGRYNDTVKRTVGRSYEGAVSTRLGMAGYGSDVLALDRVDVCYLARPILFNALMSPGLRLYLAVRRPLRALAGDLLRRPWV